MFVMIDDSLPLYFIAVTTIRPQVGIVEYPDQRQVNNDPNQNLLKRSLKVHLQTLF